MTHAVPVSILLVKDLHAFATHLDCWMADTRPAAALVFSAVVPATQNPHATFYHVPAEQWLTLSGCLCCMSATDPRLILLHALDKGVSTPPQSVDHIVIIVPPGHLTPVLRVLDSLTPVTDHIAPATVVRTEAVASSAA